MQNHVMSIANSSHELVCFNLQPDGGDERVRLRERARQTRASGVTHTPLRACVCACVCVCVCVCARVSHALTRILAPHTCNGG